MNPVAILEGQLFFHFVEREAKVQTGPRSPEELEQSENWKAECLVSNPGPGLLEQAAPWINLTIQNQVRLGREALKQVDTDFP